MISQWSLIPCHQLCVHERMPEVLSCIADGIAEALNSLLRWQFALKTENHIIVAISGNMPLDF